MPTSRLIILMLLFNILTVAGGVGASYWLLKPGDEGEAAAEAAPVAPAKYEYFTVEKIIVSVAEAGREHYFVLDLALQAEAGEKPVEFEPAVPLVRNSVVAYLSSLGYRELRGMPIVELQQRLEVALFDDFAQKNAEIPFKHVLVNKLLVQ